MQPGTRIFATAFALTIAAIAVLMLVLLAIWLAAKLHKHRTRLTPAPHSVVTPLGYIPMWDWDTQEMYVAGVERARTRQYCNPRGEQ